MEPLKASALDLEDLKYADRRNAPRSKTMKAAQIVWPDRVTAFECIMRNISDTGACLEIRNPVPIGFDLIFDEGRSRRRCRVVWRETTRIGVKFD